MPKVSEVLIDYKQQLSRRQPQWQKAGIQQSRRLAIIGFGRMTKISLKKLCAKKQVLAVINNLIEAMDTSIAILDERGNLVLGESRPVFEAKHPVELEGEAIGWVAGEEKAAAIAKLISYLASQELNQKRLAREVLDKYREITFLYDGAEKIIASLEPKEIANIVLAEARKSIGATSGCVMLLHEGRGVLESIAAFGSEYNLKTTIGLGEGIISNVVLSGKGEIINDVFSDPRFPESISDSLESVVPIWGGRPEVGSALKIWGFPAPKTSVSALACVPLKTKDKVIGAIAISSSQPISYVAEDLKVLATLASQAACAINALLHENKLKESRREALLFRLASEINNSLDLNTILETATSEIRSLLGIDICLFLWYRPKGIQQPELKTENENPLSAKSSGLSAVGDRSAMNSGLAVLGSPGWEVVNEAKTLALPSLIGYYSSQEMGKWVEQIRQMKVVRIDEVKDSADPAMADFFLSRDLSSILAVPIQTRSGEIGAISCANNRKGNGEGNREGDREGNREGRTWSDKDIDLLQGVANQLAIALERAELYHQNSRAARVAEEKAEQLEATLLELKTTQGQLVQAEKMSSIGNMVAGVAHEINNPTNFINGNILHARNYIEELLEILNLYQEEYPTLTPELRAKMEDVELEFMMEDLPKLIDSMQEGTDRIHKIVLALRNFSRLDEAEIKAVEIHEGIESTLLILGDRLRPKPNHPLVRVIKEYGNIPLVECYAKQLNQVFMHLLANAIDALELGATDGGAGTGFLQSPLPTLTIRTELLTPEEDGKNSARESAAAPVAAKSVAAGARSDSPTETRGAFRVLIRIADNGPGIPEDIQGKLFDPFFTTKPVGKGTGLGLSVSYQIVVEKHGGQLLCISQPGRGAEFIIELPIRQPPKS